MIKKYFKMFKLTVFNFVLLLVSIVTKSTIESGKIRRESIANYKDFKYQASVRVEYDEFWIHHCSGAILSDNHVVTTASCVSNYKPMDVKIVVGSDNFDPIFTIGSWHPLNTVIHIYIHRRFNATYSEFTAFDYDIAIIKTEFSLQPSGLFGTIEPATPTIDIRDGEHGTMTLWNIIGTSGRCYNKLMLKDGRKVNDYQCECVYPDSVSSQMMCFDFDESCYGETGAPLSIIKEGNPVLVGIYSWHGNCIKMSNPAVFTRISSFIDWILSVINYNPPKYQCKSLNSGKDFIELK